MPINFENLKICGKITFFAFSWQVDGKFNGVFSDTLQEPPYFPATGYVALLQLFMSRNDITHFWNDSHRQPVADPGFLIRGTNLLTNTPQSTVNNVKKKFLEFFFIILLNIFSKNK